MRRLQSLHERAVPPSSAAKVASDIEDHVERAVKLARTLFKSDSEETSTAALALERALSEVARNQVVELLRVAQD